jgi:AbrB family looped-hinge helix DNA binding protein
MSAHRTRIAEGGRLVIPAEFRRKLGLNPGDSVVIDIADGELRVRSLRAAVQRAQALVRRYIPADVNLSEELIRDRRAEAKRE